MGTQVSIFIEGEETLFELLTKPKKLWPAIKGIAFKDEGKIIITENNIEKYSAPSNSFGFFPNKLFMLMAVIGRAK